MTSAQVSGGFLTTAVSSINPKTPERLTHSSKPPLAKRSCVVFPLVAVGAGSHSTDSPSAVSTSQRDTPHCTGVTSAHPCTSGDPK